MAGKCRIYNYFNQKICIELFDTNHIFQNKNFASQQQTKRIHYFCDKVNHKFKLYYIRLSFLFSHRLKYHSEYSVLAELDSQFFKVGLFIPLFQHPLLIILFENILLGILFMILILVVQSENVKNYENIEGFNDYYKNIF